MNSQLHFLIELQKFDLRIFEIKDQQQKLPQLIKSAQAPFLDIAQRLKTLKDAEAGARQGSLGVDIPIQRTLEYSSKGRPERQFMLFVLV